MQVNYSWILPTYVNEDLVKQKPDQRIEDLQQPQASSKTAASSPGTVSAGASARIGTFERGNGSALCQTRPCETEVPCSFFSQGSQTQPVQN